jgi:hypothetical protein
MVRHLAHQHDIHALVADRWRTGTSECGRNAAGRSEGGGHPVELEAKGQQPDPPARGPAGRHPGQISEAGAEIQQGQRRAPGYPGECPRQSKSHRRGAAEPPVGPADVAQRLGHGGGVGQRVIEQLLTDGRDRHPGHDYLPSAA